MFVTGITVPLLICGEGRSFVVTVLERRYDPRQVCGPDDRRTGAPYKQKTYREHCCISTRVVHYAYRPLVDWCLYTPTSVSKHRPLVVSCSEVLAVVSCPTAALARRNCKQVMWRRLHRICRATGTPFLGSTRVSTPNRTLIHSAVFAQRSHMTDVRIINCKVPHLQHPNVAQKKPKHSTRRRITSHDCD